MTCAYGTDEEMAEAGLTQDEIDLLQKEITLAREVAKANSFASGDTLRQQENRMDEAEREARKVAHDRFHRRLQDMSDDIARMAAWQKAHPGQHYHESPITEYAGISVSDKKLSAS